MRTINIEKALSYPICTGRFFDRGVDPYSTEPDAVCAFGAVMAGMGYSTGKSRWHKVWTDLKYAIHSFTGTATSYTNILWENDASTTTPERRMQLRKEAIALTIACGFAVPRDEDLELYREFAGELNNRIASDSQTMTDPASLVK